MEQGSFSSPSASRLFVGNISSQVTEGDLRAIVGQFGAVKDVRLERAKAKDRNRGFALVEMLDERAAAHAIATLNGIEMDGGCLSVRLDN